jgi:hypothetical protein
MEFSSALRHFLQSILVASKRPAIYEDIEAGILAFDDDVQGGAHRQQFIASVHG